METAKEEVRRILDSLPDDATFEDIQYPDLCAASDRRRRTRC
jgi:hypothetical protein